MLFETKEKEALERELIAKGSHYGVPREWQREYLDAVKRERERERERK